MLNTEERLTKTEVQRRVSDWRKRLKKLFSEIEDWSECYIPEARRMCAEIEVLEDIMKEHGVKSIKLPTVNLVLGEKRLAFVPSTLWIVGANGRVNIVGNDRVLTLLDKGPKSGKSSKWVIASRKLDEKDSPFNKTRFKNLVAATLMR